MGDYTFNWFSAGVQQWGLCMPGSNQLAVAFSELIYVLTALDRTAATTPDGYYAFAPDRGTLSSIYVAATSTTGQGNYLIAGKQQWGLWSQNNTYANVLFTLSYPQQCLNVIASNHNDTSTDTAGIGEALLISDITVNGFRVSKQNNYINVIWISLGNQQWGILENNIGVFPIAFSQFVSTGDTAVRTGSSASWYGSNGKITLSQISVTFSNYTNIGAYIAVGMQQWGSNQQTVSAETLVTYPIAVNTVLTILCAADQSDIQDAEYAGPGSVTTVNFVASTLALLGNIHAQPYPYYWIMVGIVQQWGSKNVTGNGSGTLLTTIKFPTAFSACWAVTANLVVTNADYDVDKYVVIGGITVSQFKVTLDSEVTDTEKTFKTNWLAIGRQQIKRRRYHNRRHIKLFLQIVYQHHKRQLRHY